MAVLRSEIARRVPDRAREASWLGPRAPRTQSINSTFLADARRHTAHRDQAPQQSGHPVHTSVLQGEPRSRLPTVPPLQRIRAVHSWLVPGRPDLSTHFSCGTADTLNSPTAQLACPAATIDTTMSEQVVNK